MAATANSHSIFTHIERLSYLTSFLPDSITVAKEDSMINRVFTTIPVPSVPNGDHWPVFNWHMDILFGEDRCNTDGNLLFIQCERIQKYMNQHLVLWITIFAVEQKSVVHLLVLKLKMKITVLQNGIEQNHNLQLEFTIVMGMNRLRIQNSGKFETFTQQKTSKDI
ncbi:hypothetical protein BDQ17DRAFT_1416143 [Cyathus striatus]|nr:hypothetical protein BDQ17DRAFT_1416143 [Cyathus striatus]